MTSTPAAQIAHVLELDKMRSPGEWAVRVHHNPVYGTTNRWITSDSWYVTSGCEALTEENAAFIASAPLMAQIIREQQEVIKQLVGAMLQAQDAALAVIKYHEAIEENTNEPSNVRFYAREREGGARSAFIAARDAMQHALALAKPLLGEK